MIERGVDAALTADVYDAAGVQQTPTAATVAIYAGSKLIVDATAVHAAPSTYTLLAALTADESLSDEWQERWSLTIGGTVYTFRRDAYLVRHILYPVITDTDLTELHSDLADLRDADQSTFEVQRTAAWGRIERKLIALGSRPQLVLNAWVLKDVHVWTTLAILFADFASSVGGGRYLELADHYRGRVADWWESDAVFRYDADEDGYEEENDQRPGSPIVYLSRPPMW